MNNTSVFSLVNEKSISLPLFSYLSFCVFILLSHTLIYKLKWTECVCACMCACVSQLQSPTVTKWFDRPCHIVDKWWMGARQHTIKPVNLTGNATIHLPPDVCPVNTQANKGRRQEHTHAHTETCLNSTSP